MQLHKSLQHLDVEVIPGGQKGRWEKSDFQYYSISQPFLFLKNNRDIKTPRRRFMITEHNVEPRRQGEENHISPMKAFLNLNLCFSTFLSCLCPYSYWALSTASGGNLNSWPVLVVLPPRGDKEQLEPNPHRLLFVRGLFGRRRAFGGKIHSWSQAAVTVSLILFVVYQDPWSWSGIVSVLCNVQMKPGIHRLSILCFLWKDCWEEKECWLSWNKQQNRIAITFLDYLDDDLRAFLLHWVFVTALYPILAPAAKSN